MIDLVGYLAAGGLLWLVISGRLQVKRASHQADTAPMREPAKTVQTKEGRVLWRPPAELTPADILWLRAQAILFEDVCDIAWPRAKGTPEECGDHVYELGSINCVMCGVHFDDDFPARRRWDAVQAKRVAHRMA